MKAWSVALSLPLVLGMAAWSSPAAAAAPPPATAVALPDSMQWDMPGTQGHDYRVFVSRPAGPAPAGGYPVLYVLDANELYLTVVETVRAFEHRPDVARDRPGTVVVGIGYPPGTDVRAARTLDLTPAGSNDPRVKGGGGADMFADFIEQRLKPEVAGRVPVDPRRQAVFGHSFGGLWVLHTLATRPGMFQDYLASSAALWFGDNAVLSSLRRMAAARTAQDAPLRAQLTVGEFEEFPAPWAPAPGGDVVAMAKDLRQRDQVGNARQAATLLAAAPRMDVEFDELAGEDHGSVVPGAISRAVRFLQMPVPAPAPPVPTARQYWDLSPEQRYALRLQVRELPDAVRIPWLTQLKRTLEEGLSEEDDLQLHQECDRMDQVHGTRPHEENAQ